MLLKDESSSVFLFLSLCRKNADDPSLSGIDLRPLAVLRRKPVPQDERKESQVAVPRLQQARALRQPPARRLLQRRSLVVEASLFILGQC